MLISDVIYEKFTVAPVLQELIQSNPVKRLNGVHQGGAIYLVNPEWNVTRYEHSLGVMLLIKKMGGSVEEQIAGLLHDISHTAFSHVIDYALENRHENYHEEIFEEILIKSDVPSILEKFGYDYRDIVLDESKWSILEQPAPDLCADRVDYTLRDMFQYGMISLDEVKSFLDSLKVVEGKMCLDSIDAAEWFVETYYKEVIDFFLGPLNIYSNDRFAKIIKRALEVGVLTLDDLLKQDHEVIEQLQASQDEDILKGLGQLNKHVEVEENESDYDLHRTNKVRLIDPLVQVNGSVKRVSKVSDRVKAMNQKAYEKSLRGTYVKVKSV